LAAALELQVRTLETVNGRFGDARRLLPPADGAGVWRGAAHTGYVSAISVLATQLDAAAQLLERSIAQSRLALAAVSRG
jgi:hypothetical protein